MKCMKRLLWKLVGMWSEVKVWWYDMTDWWDDDPPDEWKRVEREERRAVGKTAGKRR